MLLLKIKLNCHLSELAVTKIRTYRPRLLQQNRRRLNLKWQLPRVGRSRMQQVDQSRPHGTRQNESDQVPMAEPASEKTLSVSIEGPTHSSINDNAAFTVLQPYLPSKQSSGISPPLIALPVNLIRRKVQPFKQGASSMGRWSISLRLWRGGGFSTSHFRASRDIVERKIRIEPSSQGSCSCIG